MNVMNFSLPLFSSVSTSLMLAALSLLSPVAAQTNAQTNVQTNAQIAKQNTPHISEPSLRAHLAYLSDDLLEGRGTGQRGGELAVAYLETQVALLGLQPLPQLANTPHPFRQQVAIVGTKTLPHSEIEFVSTKGSWRPRLGEDVVLANSNGQTKLSVDAELVFVGYGITAPEEKWDDYKGTDVRGKLLVMMVNDPPATPEEPQRFGAAAMTYYGRWMYKFEEAARRGAAGAILIHTTASAAYGWNVPQTSFMNERFSLAGRGNAVEAWIQDHAAKQLFAANQLDLDQLRLAATRRDFKPVALGARAQVNLFSQLRNLVQSNVMGMVPGDDTKLRDEAVIYSAHWDHLGKVDVPGQATKIWNGAVDNASGTAALLAMAEQANKQPTRRTQIFLWPAAEEQGLIGSLYYVQNPVWPLKKTVADLNLDSMNFVGKTKDIGIAGSERSSLEQDARAVAAQMGLRIAPSVPDLGGAFFRADHFNFARYGVPAFNVGSAVFSGDGHFDYVDHAPDSMQKMKAFTRAYHTEQDRYDPNWDLSGMAQQALFTLRLGQRLGNAKQAPAWKAGDPYARVRQAQ